MVVEQQPDYSAAIWHGHGATPERSGIVKKAAAHADEQAATARIRGIPNEAWHPTRNELLGFADRTRKNLDFIIEARRKHEPVHVVTQVVLSMLGIVVFPFERGQLGSEEDELLLTALEADGWPRWEIDAGSAETTTLSQLLRRIRNATAHNDIEFNSDSDSLDQVTISFTERSARERHWRWTGHIRADDLLKFCRRFLDLVEQRVG